MAPEAPATPTRKTLLAGGLGGLLAMLGGALARPEEADAANDPEAVHKGVNNPTSASTSVTCSGATAIRGVSPSGGADRSGVFGTASGTNARGVTGIGPFGVLGLSNGAQGRGVRGIAGAASGAPVGVLGTSVAPAGIAVLGKNTATGGDAFGVRGESSGTAAVVGRNLSTASTGGVPYGVLGSTNSPIGSGVHGDHNASSGTGSGVSGTASEPNAVGVRGENLSDTGDAVGVKGMTLSPQGTGVEGRAEGTTGEGIGVYGVTERAEGVGGWFEAPSGGTGLVVRGSADLETSGVATVPASGTSVSVTQASAKTTSVVLCTFLEDPGGRSLHVVRSNGSFQIVVSPAATAGEPISVAWLLLEN